MGFLQSAIIGYGAARLGKARLGSEEWTITDKNGNALLPIYSINGLPSITAGGKAVSAPVEQNSFQTYNKTSEPIEVQMDIVFEGTNAEIQNGLTKTLELKESTETFSIVTPYYEFENMTLESLNYSQTTSNGLGSVLVSLVCREVKEVTVAYTTVSQKAIQANQQAPASSAGADSTPISAADATDPSDTSMVDTGQTATAAPSYSEAETAEPKRQSVLKQMGGVF